ncbi:MAG: HIT domain-containing protein [Gammaproteobacteria bacterium]|nr:HIT domain-containing protein [Gammaproteobacteria bacterium]MBQ0840726.1 HIT domain-containing protein [Gammaproteobacteria bacterium]
MFKLDQRLQKDTVVVGRFELCLLLLHRDGNYPWFILVPQREGAREIHHLSATEQQLLLAESALVAGALETVFVPDKLNIAMLGNIVAQLHIHHVARFETDISWPGPIWGAAPAGEYEASLLEQRLESMRKALLGKIEIAGC